MAILVKHAPFGIFVDLFVSPKSNCKEYKGCVSTNFSFSSAQYKTKDSISKQVYLFANF